MRVVAISLVCLLLGAATAHARALDTSTPASNGGSAKPVVIWHGMGDSCCSLASTGSLVRAIEDDLGVFVHSISTGSDDSEAKDVLSSFWGNVNDQVATVCDELEGMKELRGGFNMIGLSQGSQFLRAVVQRCGHRLPPVHTLISIGGQHQGVMNVPGCKSGMSGVAAKACTAMELMLGRGAYAFWVRDNVVQAQYFKDPKNMDAYLANNIFLPDINNEHASKNAAYADNLAALERLVLLRFTNDTTVVPRDSSWFSFYDGTSIVPLQQQPIYKEDWLGLKRLDAKGGLVFGDIPGEHMQFSMKWFRSSIIDAYLAGTDSPSSVLAVS